MEPPATSAGLSSRIKACEPCRANKLRCRPSQQQPGVCQRCLDSKKECVSRAGPRGRRARQLDVRTGVPSGCPASASTSAPDADPKGTFSIDCAVADDNGGDGTFEMLKSIHETHVDTVLPPKEEDFLIIDHEVRSLSDTIPSVPTPSSSQKSSLSAHPLDRRPQFDLATAQSLLESFTSLSSHFSCVSIPQGATVQGLASTRPFLLLAILASAAGSKTLQGHGLYDAEFRKVLGLKYVAGGERSLELLQGLLVYCSWYPFQLRPRMQQLLQYVRMMSDLVQDLSLDEESQEIEHWEEDVKLERLRAYISYSYLKASMLISWLPRKGFSKINTSWTLQCCDTLKSCVGCTTSDMNLCNLARLCMVNYTATTIFNPSDAGEDEDHRRILLLGLKAQARELQQHIKAAFSLTPSVELASLFLTLYLDAASLLQKPGPQTKCPHMNKAFKSEHRDVVAAVNTTKQLLDYVATFDQSTFASLTTHDWCRIILTIIISMRVSFPMADYPQFDYVQARVRLQLSDFLGRVCDDAMDIPPAPSSAKVDIQSATRVVLRIVKRKYDERVAEEEAKRLEGMEPAFDDVRISCPVLDGSVDQVLPAWDAWTTPMPMDMPEYVGESGLMTPQSRSTGQEPVFHDIWATMTMGWARDNSTD